MAVDATNETIGGLLTLSYTSYSWLYSSNVIGIIARISSTIYYHEIVVQLIEHLGLLTAYRLCIITASTASQCTLHIRHTRSLHGTYETVACCLVHLLSLHSNDMKATIALLENLTMHLLVLVLNPNSIQAILITYLQVRILAIYSIIGATILIDTIQITARLYLWMQTCRSTNCDSTCLWPAGHLLSTYFILHRVTLRVMLLLIRGWHHN